MKRHQFTTTDEFINSFPKDTGAVLKKLRLAIKQTIPRAEQTISYNIPCFKLNGKYVVYFAGYAKHVSIYPIPKETALFKESLTKYQTGKGTLRFPLHEPLPLTFIKKVVRQLARENIARIKKSL
jgi:uncharacterized protein YdhG (YjbR/CyaY superfamily)